MPLRTRPPARRVPLADGSEYAGVHIKTLRNWIKTGRITGYRVGPKLLQVDLDELDAQIRPVSNARAS